MLLTARCLARLLRGTERSKREKERLFSRKAFRERGSAQTASQMLSRILSLESLKLFMPSSAPEKGELTRTLEGDEGREQEGGDAMEGREKEGDTNGWLAPDTHEKHQPTQEELLAKETVKTFSAISSRDG
jgi:hypothetical protein